MERLLKQVRDLAREHQAVVICAGDIFDRWNSSPELINWAIERLPHLYAIPGNHDLPYHRTDLAYRSAYGTLVRAGIITELEPEGRIIGPIAIYSQEFGEDDPTSHLIDENVGAHVLVMHRYVWTQGNSHPGAPDDGMADHIAKKSKDFSIVIAGDNHHPFDIEIGGVHLINCGTLIRRRASEARIRPRVAMIHRSGEVDFHYLDTSNDKIDTSITQQQEDADEHKDVEKFVEELTKLEATSLSYRDAIIQAMEARRIRPEVRKEILEAME